MENENVKEAKRLYEVLKYNAIISELGFDNQNMSDLKEKLKKYIEENQEFYLKLYDVHTGKFENAEIEQNGKLYFSNETHKYNSKFIKKFLNDYEILDSYGYVKLIDVSTKKEGHLL